MRLMLRLIGLLLLATLVLAGCGGDDGGDGGGTSDARPTRTARPQATEEEDEPTATRRAVRPTPTSDDDDEAAAEEPGRLETISSLEGDFTIDCPNNWKVDVGTRSLRCAHPQEEVVIQINTNELGTTMESEELGEQTKTELEKNFGENYVDQGMELQGDGSMRIDFEVTANEEHGTPDLLGRAFVEEHDEVFYLFMVLIDAGKVEQHNDIVEEIIGSYAIEAAQ